MLISLKWLEQYLPEKINITNEELAERLTYSLAEVESITKIGDKLKNIVIGEIIDIKPHPKAEKLQLAIVNTLDSKRTIVCGASNIFIGAKVPVALPGAIVLNPKQELGNQDPIEISETEIRNVKSQGMLASQKELGISNDHEGIWILPDDAVVGSDLVSEISDSIFEIENKTLTHRPDCFCHVGIAREISAILQTQFSYIVNNNPLVATKSLPFVAKIENKNLCLRYCAIVLEGVHIAPSPFWLQLKLLLCGIRPINNIVDITNYIMLDIGQPLHAFDYNKLSSPRIIVRNAKDKEKIQTLDGVERELSSENLVIADPKKPIAIAGIMGGLASEIDNNTKDIIIESANFEMYSTRRSSMSLGLRTEASTRYEKGLDPNLAYTSICQAANLITEIAGGEIASNLIDIYPNKQEEKVIEFETKDVKKLLGIEMSKEEMLQKLRSLQLNIETKDALATKIFIAVPSFRRDLNIKEDILEELARLYGYNNFKPILPTKEINPVKPNKQRLFDQLAKRTLSALGFDEVSTYSFTGEEFYTKTLMDINNCIKIKNPVSPELSYLRSSLIPNLLDKVLLNQFNFDQIEIYEIGRIYLKVKDASGILKQPKNLVMVSFNEGRVEDLFFNFKGKLETFLHTLNFSDVKFKVSNTSKFLDERIQLQIYFKNKLAGFLGAVSNIVKSNWDIKGSIVLCNLDFDLLCEHYKPKRAYKKISKFQYIKRDLSFLIDKKIYINDLICDLSKVKSKYIKNIQVLDVYFDKKFGSKKSITIQITIEQINKTLSNEEINYEIEKLIKIIENLKGNIRKKN